VLEDVREDYVSVEAARREYGVVMAGIPTALTVDVEATAAERGRRGAAP